MAYLLVAVGLAIAVGAMCYWTDPKKRTLFAFGYAIFNSDFVRWALTWYLRGKFKTSHTKKGVTVALSPSVDVSVIPMLGDNYSYLIIDRDTGESLVVDPVEADKAISAACDASDAARPDVQIKTILTTHHHWDHSGGNNDLVRAIPGLRVVGCGETDARAPQVNHIMRDQDVLRFSNNITVTAHYTPCHTQDHLCFQIDGPGFPAPALFCGDTLFVGGCGKFFEGSPQQMDTALNKTLASRLAGKTVCFPGHEYTVKNLTFAVGVEPGNVAARKKLEWARQRRADCLPTVPTTWAEEKEHNVFMRVRQEQLVEGVLNQMRAEFVVKNPGVAESDADVPSMAEFMDSDVGAGDVMSALRRLKDAF